MKEMYVKDKIFLERARAHTLKYGPPLMVLFRMLTGCRLRAALQTNNKASWWVLCSKALKDTLEKLDFFSSLCLFALLPINTQSTNEITTCIKGTSLQTFFL